MVFSWVGIIMGQCAINCRMCTGVGAQPGAGGLDKMGGDMVVVVVKLTVLW